MKTKKKPKSAANLVTGRDPVAQLYRAVIRYVESNGGSLMVIGGIEIQEWPEERAGVFRIGVKCMGRKPTPPQSNRTAKESGDG